MFCSTDEKTVAEAKNIVAAVNDKWQAIALSTEPVNFAKLENNIRIFYQILGYPPPEIIFYQSPGLIWEHLLKIAFDDVESEEINKLKIFFKTKLKNSKQGLLKELVCQLTDLLKKNLDSYLGSSLKSIWQNKFCHQINKNKSVNADNKLKKLPSENLINLQFKEGLNQLISQRQSQLNSQLLIKVFKQLATEIKSSSLSRALEQIILSLSQSRSTHFLHSLGNLLGKSLFSSSCIQPELWAIEASKIEFFNTLGNFCPSKEWKLFEEIINNCGWFLPYENICLISDRPRKLHLNHQYCLHADGELAIEFADGQGFYAYEGVIIPRKYGQLEAKNWQSQWLLEEQNAELRRVLIRGLGYDRLAAELEAEEIDSWQEYTLVRFNKIIDDVDEQPICLLKMTCPSTKYIHALRIPPNFYSAREAIRWINWNIDPEDIVLAS